MALAFDTGQPKAQRSLFFDAIVVALADLMRANGGYLRTVKRIARTVRAAVNETHDEFGMHLVEQASQGCMPCVLVAFGDAKYQSASTDPIDSYSELDVQILIVSSHLGGFEAGRIVADAAAGADATQDPGLDTMLEHVEERLMGQNLGVPGVHELRWHHVGEVDTFDQYTAWEARASVVLERHINPDRDEDRIDVEIETKNQLDGIPTGGDLDPIVDSVVTLEAT